MTSTLLAFFTICIAQASTIISAGSMRGCFWATLRKISRNIPSVIFMMLALCTAVTRMRPMRSA